MFCAVTETTKEVLGERRLRTLRILASDTAEAHSPQEVCRIAAGILADDPDDLPFTLLYLLAPEGNFLHLAATTGIASGTLTTPLTLALDDPEAAWPLAQVTETGLVAQIDELAARFGTISGPLHDTERLTPQTALILPITRAGQEHPYGFLIAGISPRRLLDEDYRGFLQLLAGQIATACASAGNAIGVSYATVAGGTATGGASCIGGVDYVSASGMLSWASGDTVWLLDVIAGDRKAATAVLANFRQLSGERAVKIHPLVARLLGIGGVLVLSPLVYVAAWILMPNDAGGTQAAGSST